MATDWVLNFLARKTHLFHLINQITLVLLMWKWMSLSLLKNCIFPEWECLSLLHWTRVPVLFLLLKLSIRNLNLESANFYSFTKWWPFKNYEKCFLFHLKTSFRSRDIQIFVIFSLPFQTFQIQKGKGKWNNLWCHELACINLQM